jgi:hypothetical protein
LLQRQTTGRAEIRKPINLYDVAGKKFLLGETLDGGPPDLPRNLPTDRTVPRRALIGDPRESLGSRFG